MRPATRFGSRLATIRAEMRRAGVSALVITSLPNVRYLCGFDGSAGLVLVTSDACRLVVDFRYATAAREIVRAHPDLESAVTVVVPPRSYDEALIELLQASGARRIGIEAAHMSVQRFNRLSAALASAAPMPVDSETPCPVLVPTERMVERCRAVKDADEVAVLRAAARLLAAVAAEVPAFVREGRSELEVAAEIDAALRRHGFERPAFDTIVASGPNGAHPHARPGARRMAAGEGVVLDFGGVYDGYCVDLTRTVAIGAPPPEFRRLQGAVAEAQAAAIAAVRPGVPASAVDAAAREVLGRYGLRDAFGHGTGHGLGLEVHEEPRVAQPVKGLPDAVLEPGMVFTIEPGVYVEGLGGVRIEDDVLVTGTGCDVLTRPQGGAVPVAGG